MKGKVEKIEGDIEIRKEIEVKEIEISKERKKVEM